MASANPSTQRWPAIARGACAVTLGVIGVLLVGPPPQAASVQTRIIKVQTGVVQSTVSGSGNVQAASQLNLGFKTAGVVQRIYVTQGAYVTPGKLLAELNPQSAEVTLEQAKAALQAAEATLAQEEENGGETSSGQSRGTTGGDDAHADKDHLEHDAQLDQHDGGLRRIQRLDEGLRKTETEPGHARSQPRVRESLGEAVSSTT